VRAHRLGKMRIASNPEQRDEKTGNGYEREAVRRKFFMCKVTHLRSGMLVPLQSRFQLAATETRRLRVMTQIVRRLRPIRKGFGRVIREVLDEVAFHVPSFWTFRLVPS